MTINVYFFFKKYLKILIILINYTKITLQLDIKHNTKSVYSAILCILFFEIYEYYHEFHF